MGLRDPIPVQFGRYLSEVVQGDLGNSYQRPKNGMMGQGGDFNANMDVEMAEVSDLILERLPYTLQLAGLALLISLIISFPLGISAGLKPKGFMSKIAFFISSVFVSIPNFWLGIVLALFITIKLGLLPSIGYQNFAYTILPAIVLAVETCPFIIRTISVSFAEISQEYFIKSGILPSSVSEKIICTSGNSVELLAISVSDFAASIQCSQPASKKHNIFFPSLILKASSTYEEYEEICLLLEFVAIGNNENIRTEIIK